MTPLEDLQQFLRSYGIDASEQWEPITIVNLVKGNDGKWGYTIRTHSKQLSGPVNFLDAWSDWDFVRPLFYRGQWCPISPCREFFLVPEFGWRRLSELDLP